MDGLVEMVAGWIIVICFSCVGLLLLAIVLNAVWK